MFTFCVLNSLLNSIVCGTNQNNWWEVSFVVDLIYIGLQLLFVLRLGFNKVYLPVSKSKVFQSCGEAKEFYGFFCNVKS